MQCRLSFTVIACYTVQGDPNKIFCEFCDRKGEHVHVGLCNDAGYYICVTLGALTGKHDGFPFGNALKGVHYVSQS